MAISLGATSENLLRGIDRLIASVADVLPVSRASTSARIPRAWASQRGEDLAKAQVEVFGGFPGSVRWQHHLSNTTLHITDGWMILGEGTNAGFALPLNRIAYVAVQSFGGLQPPSLAVWYQDADMLGSFLISFRGTARNRQGVLRADCMCATLHDLGIQILEDHSTAFIPSVHCSWDDIDDLADDEALFSGRVVASVAGPFGSVLDTCELWITERSLIWCPEHGTGLNCLPLDAIIDCRNGFGDRLSIGIQDAVGGRYDLYFDFTSRDDRTREASWIAHDGATQVKHLLAAAGIPTGTAVVPIAPWRSGGTRRPSDI